MKITHIIAAATMLAGLGVSTAASAQDYRGDRYERRDDRRDGRRDYRDDRRYDRGRHYGWNNGRNHGWNGGRGRCHSEWRHHRRVTVCYR